MALVQDTTHQEADSASDSLVEPTDIAIDGEPAAAAAAAPAESDPFADMVTAAESGDKGAMARIFMEMQASIADTVTARLRAEPKPAKAPRGVGLLRKVARGGAARAPRLGQRAPMAPVGRAVGRRSLAAAAVSGRSSSGGTSGRCRQISMFCMLSGLVDDFFAALGYDPSPTQMTDISSLIREHTYDHAPVVPDTPVESADPISGPDDVRLSADFWCAVQAIMPPGPSKVGNDNKVVPFYEEILVEFAETGELPEVAAASGRSSRGSKGSRTTYNVFQKAMTRARTDKSRPDAAEIAEYIAEMGGWQPAQKVLWAIAKANKIDPRNVVDEYEIPNLAEFLDDDDEDVDDSE